MAYKRILTIQDISCVGQCSMTVALPILSSCGHETCILPTALLSTHTGGFGKPQVVHLNGLDGFVRHWKENNITFDAILTGYLGSVSAVELVSELSDQLLSPNGILIVDPAMADHGRLYSGLSDAYAQAMMALCKKADIIIPNVTEAAMMAGMDYRSELDATYVSDLLKNSDHPCVVLTGVGYGEGKTGILLSEEGNLYHYTHEKINQNFHGTGDMFAACFTGALLQGISKEKSIRIAADFVKESISITARNPAHWYGVRFESALPELIRKLQEPTE